MEADQAQASGGWRGRAARGTAAYHERSADQAGPIGHRVKADAVGVWPDPKSLRAWALPGRSDRLVPELRQELVDRQDFDPVLGGPSMRLERDDDSADPRPVLAEGPQALQILRRNGP